MLHNPNPPSLTQQLSVGNIINVTLNLYRTNFKLYLRLSFFAYLWLLVPVYGWAKFLAISALISRLAFCELMGQPENVKDASRSIRPRTLSFLVTAILLSILLFIVLLASFIATGLFLASIQIEQVLAPLEVISNESFVKNNLVASVFLFVLLVLVLLLFFACLFVPTLWVYSRFFVTELPLASETKVNLITALCRSWKLTRGYFWRIQIILVIAIVLLLPIELLVYLLGEAINAFATKVMAGLILPYPLVDSILVTMFAWGITVLNAMVLMPLFQVIKGVVYYNLRLRREGLGLRLRDLL